MNSHLAAYDEMVDRRNTDFHDLSSRLLFRRQTDVNVEVPAENSQYVDISVFDTDVLFWMGGRWTTPPRRYLRVDLGHGIDLNYRVDLPDQSIRTLLTWPGPAEVNLAELQKHDQLRTSVREGKAFEDFKEANLTHLPYVLGTLFSPGTFLSAG